MIRTDLKDYIRHITEPQVDPHEIKVPTGTAWGPGEPFIDADIGESWVFIQYGRYNIRTGQKKFTKFLRENIHFRRYLDQADNSNRIFESAHQWSAMYGIPMDFIKLYAIQVITKGIK